MSTHHHDHPTPPASSCIGHASASASPDQHDSADLAPCPVMEGSSVVKQSAEEAGLFRDHEGQRYWLCCAACGPLFDADPARYAAA